MSGIPGDSQQLDNNVRRPWLEIGDAIVQIVVALPRTPPNAANEFAAFVLWSWVGLSRVSGDMSSFHKRNVLEPRIESYPKSGGNQSFLNWRGQY